MSASIREAFEEDAGLLSALGAETFISTFGHLYSTDNLEKFLAKSHSQAAYSALLGNPDYAVWIAHDDAGAGAGYAVAGPCTLPVPGMPPASGELVRLYLLKSAQGSGLGARLLDTALSFLRDRFEHIYLSVYHENHIAQRLYQRFGFVKIHDYFYMVGDQADPEWIMQLKS